MTLLAFLGDVHGAWTHVANVLHDLQSTHGPIAFAIAVGDSEPYRSEADMRGATAPAKYHSLGTFPELVAGRVTLPCPVYFIGGNHDPYLALDAHGPGPWSANTHYLGRAGVVTLDGIRVGFISGIFSPRNFPLPRADVKAEQQQVALKVLTYYNQNDLRVLDGAGPVDVLVTHDWPSEVPQEGRPRVFSGDPNWRALHETLTPKLHVSGHCHSWHEAQLGDVQFQALPKSEWRRGIALYRFEDGVFTRIATS